MRIRDRKPAEDCSSLSSSTPSSSSFSYTSSITASHSLASSQDSSDSNTFSLFSTASPRCRGLDLLVKAIHQVDAGSVVGVPYIQRRVTIRRRRRRNPVPGFDALVFDGFKSYGTGRIAKSCKKGKNLAATIQAPVLQSRRRRSDPCL